MKKGTIIFGVLGLLVLLLLMKGCSSQKQLAMLDENVNQAWAQVQTQYQARMDKTKNLFEIVQSSADFERGTLKDVMEARSKATSVQINANDLTPEKLAEFQKAQDAFGASLGRLLAVAENYPQLQTTSAFRDFQAQYEGMENRIAVARQDFNTATQTLNTTIRQFPTNIFAGIYGYKTRPYFTAQAGADVAPDIKSMRDAEKK